MCVMGQQKTGPFRRDPGANAALNILLHQNGFAQGQAALFPARVRSSRHLGCFIDLADGMGSLSAVVRLEPRVER